MYLYTYTMMTCWCGAFLSSADLSPSIWHSFIQARRSWAQCTSLRMCCGFRSRFCSCAGASGVAACAMLLGQATVVMNWNKLYGFHWKWGYFRILVLRGKIMISRDDILEYFGVPGYHILSDKMGWVSTETRPVHLWFPWVSIRSTHVILLILIVY